MKVGDFARQWARWASATLALVLALALTSPAGAWAPGSQVAAAAPMDGTYLIGSPKFRTIWVDPKAGKDSRSGATRKQALRTLDAAWRKIPQGKKITGKGFRILITPGTLRPTEVPNYFESRYGSAQAPILIQPADGVGTVTLPAVNIFDTRYLYLVGLKFSSELGDAVHCEKCDHFLLRDSVVRGAPRASDKVGDLLKINQSQYVYLENNDISGASDNSVDFVAVQYAEIVGNKIHDSSDWCAYVKGGSSHIRVSGNEFYDCGTGGFTAGQGTGFQFMTAPWTKYEAAEIEVTNNVVHNVEGAGFGVNGGYNVLIANNILYRVGERDHLLEFVAGHRSCDGQAGDPGRAKCSEFLAQGGWGTTRVDDGENYVRIPNLHVYVYNNVIVNPPGTQSSGAQIAVAAHYSGRWQDGSNVTVPTLFDADLQIRGNLIWDGDAEHGTGLGGEDSGCRADNLTCNNDQYLADNSINRFYPELIAPEVGNYALTPATAAALAAQRVAIPAFS